ncbi:hypothetical protein B0H14DRAFT_2576508 [Mycena olivaceomarginata]|nr:hypothetical protein B0H14DRAFT_2576508 [Mycena olivaceomarginata]
MPGPSTSAFPIERLITNGTGEWPVAAHEVEGTGVAMVRTHAMELVARYRARMRGSIWAGLTKRVSCAMGRGLQYIWARANVSWCELVRVNEDRGEAIDGQGSRTHIKIGPGAGEHGCKEKRDAPDEGNAGAGTGMG